MIHRLGRLCARHTAMHRARVCKEHHRDHEQNAYPALLSVEYAPSEDHSDIIGRTRSMGQGARNGVVRTMSAVRRIVGHFERDARATRVDYAALDAKARRRTASAATIRNEVAQLLDVFPAPIAAATEFASLTGWRLGEVLGLRRDRVDFDDRAIRLEAGESKSRKPRVVPFGPRPRLAAPLERRRAERWRVERERDVAVDTAFHREGRPLRDIDDAWRTPCRLAELEGGTSTTCADTPAPP